LQASALDNLPHDIRHRASAVFHIAVSYAFTMLKWTACENLPADLDSFETGAAADRGMSYVTMLFNDETHTYDQVEILPGLVTSITRYSCMSARL